MKSFAVDSHSHLFLLDEGAEPAVRRAARAGVRTIVCPGIDVETSRRSLEIAEANDGVFATAGLHPHDASRFDRAVLVEIEELLADPRVVAVGECGLDFFRMRSPREDQERALRGQVATATDVGVPLVVHVRDAWEAILQVLDEGRAENVVLHCFTGDVALARECAARGWYLSFAGNITYPKNDHLRRAATAVPADRILVETDAPFLSPQRLRGRDNEPANVVDVIEAVATARGEPVDNVRTTTARNAATAFPKLAAFITSPESAPNERSD
ncbi:MAG TPA: TatD family hydrolase [Actinomycetota bacterium]|nr:TatD family hydrolase [Actinomycetota bacterium]